jgi:class 3 adenylate cyclase
VATCPSCGKELPGEFPFCPFCGAPLTEQPAAALHEERKVVSVLFCDLVGFTAASEAVDPEDVRSRIRPYHTRLRQEIERYGGTVEKFIGDAVMAVFGAPTAHEDDAERAVRAGLRILEAIEELNEHDPGLSLQVRIGINTGEAVVALGARPEEGEGIVTGDVVNTASRLQAAAPVNGIVVSEQTHHATERVFDYKELEPVEVKGKAEPLAIWRPLKPRARFGSDVTRTHTAPLVGRELEKPLLIGTFERSAKQRSCQLVTIVGEPALARAASVPSSSTTSTSAPTSSPGARAAAFPMGRGSPSGRWGRSSRQSAASSSPTRPMRQRQSSSALCRPTIPTYPGSGLACSRSSARAASRPPRRSPSPPGGASASRWLRRGLPCSPSRICTGPTPPCSPSSST